MKALLFTVFLCLLNPALLVLVAPIAQFSTAEAQSINQKPLSASALTNLTPAFGDVPEDHWAYRYIETLNREGYIVGCKLSPPLYCPERALTRAEMAVFIVRGVHGAGFTPPEPTDQIFADVPITEWYAKWVHQLWNDGYTAGCGTDPLIFCPMQPHTRSEATVFFLRMVNGKNYTPPAPAGIFTDVPVSEWYAKWVEAAYNAGLIPPCQMALEERFCPEEPLTRAMAAYMMVQAKGLLKPEADLLAWRLEVTQGIQNLNNSVRLVANKQTFVRFHVLSNDRSYLTDANLVVQRGSNVAWLSPTNKPVKVQRSPSRMLINQSFLFKVPANFDQGTVTITGVLNPAKTDRGYEPLEKDYTNNSISTSVTFEPVPQVNIIIVEIGYYYIDDWVWPRHSDAVQLADWLKQAFPFYNPKILYRRLRIAGGPPTCVDVNTELLAMRTQDIRNRTVTPETRYYGMVDDRGYGDGYMTGCADYIGAEVASGPTGLPKDHTYFAWDDDGSFGDWYGAHELAHTFGRIHVRGGPHDGTCGTEAGADPSYPNDDGRISQDLSGSNAFYGFDMISESNYNIYGPDWRDVMTYCQYQWISEYTSEGLMDYFQANLGLGGIDPNEKNPTDRLLVIGTIDTVTNEVNLRPMFVLPNTGEIEERIPGNYTIIFRDPTGNELANYPFTANKIYDSELFSITELVPYIEGTTEVSIEKTGEVLTSVTAGATKPTVTLTAPSGVESIVGDSIKVSWTASDPDNDPLTFNLDYSPDNEITWQVMALNVTSQSVKISKYDILKGADGRFRVWVTDGIHTASDVSDEPFTSVESGEDQLPDQFVLKQNYPNPFNPETTIQFELPENARVELAVFNLLGQKVRVLVNEALPAGTHSARWNGTDVNGNKVTSGVYIYRLKSGEFVETKKIIFLR